ncbi:aldo/keto reductase [Streptosporangium subroseum]|uniref:aldo/keto reductase n=1 Tax=Streptosporangium subroseum TaxID=106412 RepID=UPI00343E3214
MNPRERVPLGSLTVTRLGLGLAPIGGLYTPVPDAQAFATVDRAYELGLRLFDTAPLYGYGLSEQRVFGRHCSAAVGRRRTWKSWCCVTRWRCCGVRLLDRSRTGPIDPFSRHLLAGIPRSTRSGWSCAGGSSARPDNRRT